MLENGLDSHSSGDEARTAPSPKKRKGLQKRVITVPIMGRGHYQGEGNRMKGEGSSYPPSDSWAWRKYGQQPIKGLPYPRANYRCPARKQVDRSRADPTMVIITYSSNHNHPLPAAKQHHHLPPTSTKSEHEESASASANRFVVADINEDPQIDPDFHWLAEAASSVISYPRRPIYSGSDCCAAAFSVGEEDESLFGDLGELPGCSSVFRLAKPVEREEKNRRCRLSPVPYVSNAV